MVLQFLTICRAHVSLDASKEKNVSYIKGEKIINFRTTENQPIWVQKRKNKCLHFFIFLTIFSIFSECSNHVPFFDTSIEIQEFKKRLNNLKILSLHVF